MSKKVVINGQAVTLYSLNGQTWLSSPDQLPDVMARLENTRVLLNDPKGEGASLPPKPTAARYRLRGPKQRPILQQDGVTIEGTPVPPISAAATEIRVGVEAIEVVRTNRDDEEQPVKSRVRPAEEAPQQKAAPAAPKPIKEKKAAAPEKPVTRNVKAAAPKASAPKKEAKKVAPPAKKAAPKPAPKKKAATKTPVKKKSK
jgi:hypothetical protein